MSQKNSNTPTLVPIMIILVNGKNPRYTFSQTKNVKEMGMQILGTEGGVKGTALGFTILRKIRTNFSSEISRHSNIHGGLGGNLTRVRQIT